MKRKQQVNAIYYYEICIGNRMNASDIWNTLSLKEVSNIMSRVNPREGGLPYETDGDARRLA